MVYVLGRSGSLKSPVKRIIFLILSALCHEKNEAYNCKKNV